MTNRDRDSFDDYNADDQDDGFLTFDAREEEEDRSRGPLIIVGFLAILALFGVVAWQVYANSRDVGQPPQVSADANPVKAEALPTNAVADSDLDKGVFDAASGAAAPGLDVKPDTSAEAPILTDGSAAPDPVAPAPVVVPVPAAQPAKQVAAVSPPAQKPVVKAEPKPAPAAAATKPAPTKVASVAKEKPAAPKAKAEPAPKPAAPAKPAPAPKAEAAAPASAGFAAQLGSFKDKASADTALAKFRSSGLSGPVSIVAADLGAKGTWYRIRATGFENRAEVTAFCAKAKSAGAQCIPASR
jgi:cell division protein FtsN